MMRKGMMDKRWCFSERGSWITTSDRLTKKIEKPRERATTEGVKHDITKLAETKIRNTLGTEWFICGFLESVVPRGGWYGIQSHLNFTSHDVHFCDISKECDILV